MPKLPIRVLPRGAVPTLRDAQGRPGKKRVGDSDPNPTRTQRTRKRAKLMRTTEHGEQVVVVQWLRSRGHFVAAIPNGAALRGSVVQRAKQMQRLKAEGLMPGMTDLVIITQDGSRTVFLEMKRDNKEKLTIRQLATHNLLGLHGQLTLVGFGASHAIEQLERWGL